MQECLFCRIASGDIPVDLLYADEHVVAFRDIAPKAPVHVLVIPRRHVPTLTAAAGEPDATDLLGRLLEAVVRVAGECGLERGYRTVINTGADGGQAVDHMHVHVLGGRQMDWPPG